jgi:polysaccharide export outer membrane protein
MLAGNLLLGDGAQPSNPSKSTRSAENGESGAAASNAALPAAANRIETPPDASQYRVGAGDVLGIDVWKEPDASSPSAPVLPDGKIFLPMIGQLQVAGLTPAEVSALLSDRYRAFIRAPRVTVAVKEINSHKVYVIGEVKKEGPIRVQAPITVLQALAEAGGVTDYARRRRIYILRKDQNRQATLLFDYDAVIRGEKMEQNVVLTPGDTIVVPR